VANAAILRRDHFDALLPSKRPLSTSLLPVSDKGSLDKSLHKPRQQIIDGLEPHFQRVQPGHMTGPPQQDFRLVRGGFGRGPADPVTAQLAPSLRQFLCGYAPLPRPPLNSGLNGECSATHRPVEDNGQ
jgi:hypothetical protein